MCGSRHRRLSASLPGVGRRTWCRCAGSGFQGFLKATGGSILGPVGGLGASIRGEERLMLVRHQRLAVAGVIAATAIVVPTAALASGSDSPSAKGPPPQVSVASASTSAAAAKKSAAAAGKSAAGSQLATLAASAGISTDRLQAGLMAAKRAGGHTAGG